MEVKDLNIAAAVTYNKRKQECSIYIPSLGITTHGFDFIEAQSVCISTVRAIYHYDREHNIPFPESVSLSTVTDMCTKKTMFPSYILVEV